MNESLETLNALKQQMVKLEEEAVNHEHMAKRCRQEYAEAKREHSTLLAQINDAKIVHAATSSLSICKQAEADLQSILKRLQAKESQLDKLLSAHAEPPAAVEENKEG